MPNNVIILPRSGDLVDKHQFWQYKGQNYIARLLGNDSKYGFKRNFLQVVKNTDGKHYFSIVDFQKKSFYEVRSRGVSGVFIVNSIYECVDINESGVKLAEVERSYVVRELTANPVKEAKQEQVKLVTMDAPADYSPQAMSTAAATDFDHVTSTVLKKPAEPSEKPSEKPATKFPSNDAHHVAMQLVAIAGSKEAAKAAIDAVELVAPGCVVVAKV